MVTNPKINHYPLQQEQTGLRLCKDNSYTPLHPLPLSHFILSPVSFHSLPCLISPSSLVSFYPLPYLIPPSFTPSNHQKTYPTKPLKQNDCTLRRACSRQRFKTRTCLYYYQSTYSFIEITLYPKLELEKIGVDAPLSKAPKDMLPSAFAVDWARTP